MPMDLSVLVGILIALAALWAAFLVLFWALRPKDVPLRELLRVIPDVIRLLRSVIGDRSAPLDPGWSSSACWPGSFRRST